MKFPLVGFGDSRCQNFIFLSKEIQLFVYYGKDQYILLLYHAIEFFLTE